MVKKVSTCRRIPSFDWDSLKLFLWRWSLKWPLKCPFSSHSGIRLREFLANERRLIAVEFINWSIRIKIKNSFMTISFGVLSQGPYSVLKPTHFNSVYIKRWPNKIWLIRSIFIRNSCSDLTLFITINWYGNHTLYNFFHKLKHGHFSSFISSDKK